MKTQIRIQEDYLQNFHREVAVALFGKEEGEEHYNKVYNFKTCEFDDIIVGEKINDEQCIVANSIQKPYGIYSFDEMGFLEKTLAKVLEGLALKF